MSKGKSKFEIIPKQDLKEYGRMIMLKKISYQRLLGKLSEKYPELAGMRSETLRYFMIQKKFVLNEKSFEAINLNIEKSSLMQKKRQNTVEKIMTEILSNDVFIKTFFEKKEVKIQILKLIMGLETPRKGE